MRVCLLWKVQDNLEVIGTVRTREAVNEFNNAVESKALCTNRTIFVISTNVVVSIVEVNCKTWFMCYTLIMNRSFCECLYV